MQSVPSIGLYILIAEVVGSQLVFFPATGGGQKPPWYKNHLLSGLMQKLGSSVSAPSQTAGITNSSSKHPADREFDASAHIVTSSAPNH